MTAPFTPAELEQWSRLISARLGLHFPRDRWSEMARGITLACRQLFPNAAPALESCRALLERGSLPRAQAEILASHLTIGETYFFRDPALFEALERHVLPELIAARAHTTRALRLWSAGCSTGEEPYSLAILLHRLLPDLANWRITILGTDISARALARATRATYGEWSFRGTDSAFRQAYFQPGKGEWTVREPIRRLVTLGYLNLVEDAYPSLLTNTTAMDIVLCRNVLMYFDAATQRAVLERLTRCLALEGRLIPGPCDPASHSQLRAEHYPGTILYQKVSAAPAPAAAPIEIAEPFTPRTSRRKPRPLGERKPARARATRVKTIQETPPAPGRAEQLPEDAETFASRAHELASQGESDEALRLLDRAVALQKLEPRFHFLRAMILQEQSKWNEAVEALRRVLYLDADFVLAHFALANIARERGRITEGERHAARALTLLKRLPPDEILPESEGVSAGRLREILEQSSDALVAPT